MLESRRLLPGWDGSSASVSLRWNQRAGPALSPWQPSIWHPNYKPDPRSRGQKRLAGLDPCPRQLPACQQQSASMFPFRLLLRPTGRLLTAESGQRLRVAPAVAMVALRWSCGDGRRHGRAREGVSWPVRACSWLAVEASCPPAAVLFRLFVPRFAGWCFLVV